jgi:hypothetical protein
VRSGFDEKGERNTGEKKRKCFILQGDKLTKKMGKKEAKRNNNKTEKQKLPHAARRNARGE